jgi:hypothetical protein
MLTLSAPRNLGHGAPKKLGTPLAMYSGAVAVSAAAEAETARPTYAVRSRESMCAVSDAGSGGGDGPPNICSKIARAWNGPTRFPPSSDDQRAENLKRLCVLQSERLSNELSKSREHTKQSNLRMMYKQPSKEGVALSIGNASTKKATRPKPKPLASEQVGKP